ncbi:MAG: CPBP family intramembrane metalloprotease [Armatimonadetes bacterium]|nr:CPBP family intramembrane metalloprotease [Armatimonadota bacterium]
MNVLRTILTIEACALGIAVAWGYAADIRWWEALGFPWAALLGLPAGLVLMAVSTAAARLAGDRVSFLDDLMAPLFRRVGLPEIALAAGASGFAEEALFRGVMQPLWGNLATSVIFGVLHTGRRDLLVLGPWAAAASLLLGWLYTTSGTLWCPILAHTANNFASMVYLRYFHPGHNPAEPVSME